MSRSAPHPLPLRRDWRYLIAVAILLVAAGVYVVDAARRNARQQRLIAEIESAGAYVDDNSAMLSCLRYWYEHGEFPAYRLTVVFSGSRIDNAWLRQHGYLAGLEIQYVVARDQNIKADGLAALIEAQPLEGLKLEGIQITDDVLAALRSRSSLTQFGPDFCSLTDEQFAQLPLEQFEYLSLIGTEVTPAGLQQVRRCNKLDTIWLDDRQFTRETVDLLASLGTVAHLLLYGPEISDDRLEWIPQIANLRSVDLWSVSATATGSAKLRAAMPHCKVEP